MHRVLKNAFLQTKMRKKRMFMRLTHRLIYDCFVLDFCKVWSRLIHQIRNTEKNHHLLSKKLGLTYTPKNME